MKPFLYMTKTSRQNFKYPDNKKIYLRWNKKHFSLFLKSFKLPKIESAPKMLNCAVSEWKPRTWKTDGGKGKKKEILVNVLFANFVKFLKGS